MKTCTGYAALAMVGWAVALAFFVAWNGERNKARALADDMDALRYMHTVDSMTWAARIEDADHKIATLDAYIAGRPKPEQRIHDYRTHLYGAAPDSLGAILDALPGAE